jgi:hypothetical protein
VQVHQAREIFTAMDADANGLLSRRELLLGFRRNRQ